MTSCPEKTEQNRSRIADQDLYTACSNGDGTYSGVKLAQWLFEAVTGKAMSESDARSLIDEAKARASERQVTVDK